MSNPLQAEFAFYLKNQDELVQQYDGQVIVIKNEQVIGAYATELKAIEATSKTEELGTFLVQLCSAGTESHTQTFHSRVTFA